MCAMFLFVISLRRTMLRTVREDVLEIEMADREPPYVALYQTKKKYLTAFLLSVL